MIFARRNVLFAFGSLSIALNPLPAAAHVGSQGFVLLLPTDFYITSGCIIFALTFALLALLPNSTLAHLFQTWPAPKFTPPKTLTKALGLIALITLIALILIGLRGPRDPLSNLLPLTIWTVFWVFGVSLAGIIGNYWAHLNPINGFAMLIRRPRETHPKNPIESLGQWPAVVMFLAFVSFALANPAPDDPARLANLTAAYLGLSALGIAFLGTKIWLSQCDCFSQVFRLFGALAPWQQGQIGPPGWACLSLTPKSLALGTLTIALLAAGSFDGLNETFWWLARLGINPLEFPGRSTIIWQTLFGLWGATLLLCILVAFCTWAGRLLAGTGGISFVATYTRFALTLIPIAFGYHIAHYLVSFLISIQYVFAALNDPFANGTDILGIGQRYVTTGFLAKPDTVRLIWLAQAFIIVSAHIFGVLLAHKTAHDIYQKRAKTLLSQLPFALFMLLYTLLGLWLLASPRGV